MSGDTLIVVLERRCSGDGAGVLIEATEQRFVIDHVPDAVVRLLETDQLAVEGLRQELLPVIKPKRARGADATDLEVVGITRRDDARREWSRRRMPARGGCFIVERFVRPLVVVGLPEGVEDPLLEPLSSRDLYLG